MSIFGSIAKGLGGFLAGGPVGAAAALASDIFKPRASGSVVRATPPLPVSINRASTAPFAGPGPVLRALPSLPGIGIDSTRTSGVSLWAGGPMVGTQTTYSSPKPGPGQPCPTGYHFNRTTYYTAHGKVEKGTRWVKNRRRNPLNPRALSRSMSRITSAKKAAHFLDRIQIGPCRKRRKAS